MLGSYPEYICDGLGPRVANFAVFKVELFDGGVFLPGIDRKDMVSRGCWLGSKIIEDMRRQWQDVGGHFQDAKAVEDNYTTTNLHCNKKSVQQNLRRVDRDTLKI